MFISVLISVKPTGRFKIPNREVMMNWARQITDGVEPDTDILNICVEGPVNTFEDRWPIFMEPWLGEPIKEVLATGTAISESIYRIHFLGLIHFLRPKGWEVFIEPRAGGSYIDIRLISRKKGSAALIKLRSSEKPEHRVEDALEALERIMDENRRNQESLLNIRILREYGIASYSYTSHAIGRYLELDAQGQWEEKTDPATRM
jgi:hypothetical protein